MGFSLLPLSVDEYDRPRIRPTQRAHEGGRPHLTHLTHLTHCRSSPAERDGRDLCNLIGPEFAGSTINGEDTLHLLATTVVWGRRVERCGAPSSGGLGPPSISARRVRSDDRDHRRRRPPYRRRDGRGRRRGHGVPNSLRGRIGQPLVTAPSTALPLPWSALPRDEHYKLLSTESVRTTDRCVLKFL